MALRGFSCPNCHTWFEGEGNHPRCPLCGTRASPRDLLDDREHQQPSPERASTSWEFEAPDFRPQDYELPTQQAPDYEAPQETAPDYEVPEEHQQGSSYDEVRHYEEPQSSGPTWGEETAGENEPPTPAPQPRQQSSGGSWGDRIGPIIGVVIFVLIIVSRACRALAGE